MGERTFNIVALAFPQPSASVDTRYDAVVQRYGRWADTEAVWGQRDTVLFRAVDGPTAAAIIDDLDPLGVKTEIRPVAPEPATPAAAATPVGPPCPSCQFPNPEGQAECGACGLVFAKYEQRVVRRMMKDARLEEELSKARMIDQEWTDRAAGYIRKHPLPGSALDSFTDELSAEEIPFLRLESDGGPILLTSRRMLVTFKKEGVASLPFEMMDGVELGGGFTILGGTIKMVITFKAPTFLAGQKRSSLTRQVRKDAGFDREALLHWSYSKNFLCGQCGARDLAFRYEQGRTRCRCRRCAADHLIDLKQAVARPTGAE